MMDMTDVQKKAGRKALQAFPNIKLNIERAVESCSLVPYLVSDPTKTGAPVEIIYGATSATTIEKELTNSCRILSEPG